MWQFHDNAQWPYETNKQILQSRSTWDKITIMAWKTIQTPVKKCLSQIHILPRSRETEFDTRRFKAYAPMYDMTNYYHYIHNPVHTIIMSLSLTFPQVTSDESKCPLCPSFTIHSLVLWNLLRFIEGLCTFLKKLTHEVLFKPTLISSKEICGCPDEVGEGKASTMRSVSGCHSFTSCILPSPVHRVEGNFLPSIGPQPWHSRI